MLAGGRRVSNPRPPEPQSGVLPLNYAHHKAGTSKSTLESREVEKVAEVEKVEKSESQGANLPTGRTYRLADLRSSFPQPPRRPLHPLEAEGVDGVRLQMPHGLVEVVGDLQEIEVAFGDGAVVDHLAQQRDERLPVGDADEHDRIFLNLRVLDERQRFGQLVERAEAARQRR